ncbi:hypothetical protein ACK03K_33590 [[Kitasatospora] papulosa]|uniref:hypothetical protein n=1 Tax=[Kitasatospora] papulosa TaxID=1464011 RepID=UPI003907F698
MSIQTPPTGEDELPDVDEVLARALTAEGEAGVRALGLLRDARRVLDGIGLERPGEVAEACLRGAADALLSLPGAPSRGVGLKTAAAGLPAGTTNTYAANDLNAHQRRVIPG